MITSKEAWSRLLQEFGCDSDQQLASLGIPINKNELYLEAIAAADEAEKQRYQTTAKAALLYAHYRFVHYALKNDELMMYLWAKNYGEGCEPDDALDQIHRKITEYGGLYRYSHQNVDAIGRLLSQYQNFELPADADQLAELKQIYTDSMKDLLSCAAYCLTAPKMHAPSEQEQTDEKPLPRKKQTEQGFSLSKFRSNAHFKERSEETRKKIAKYCGHLFADEKMQKIFEINHLFQKENISPQELFLSAPAKYLLKEDADGFGSSVKERFKALLREVCAAKRLSEKQILSMVQGAQEAAPEETAYASIWRDYLRSVQESELKQLVTVRERELEKMQHACDIMHGAWINDYRQSINQALSSAEVVAERRKNEFCAMQTRPDPETEEMLLRHSADVKAECDRIRAKADAVWAEFEDKVKKRRRKELVKKILLWSGIALAVSVLAAVILEVLL